MDPHSLPVRSAELRSLHMLQKRELRDEHLPESSPSQQRMRASLELKSSHPDKEIDEPVVLWCEDQMMRVVL